MVYIANLCLIAIEISLKHLDLNNIINMTCLIWFYWLFFCRMKKSLFIILGLMSTIFLVGCGSWEIKEDDDIVNNDYYVKVEQGNAIIDKFDLNVQEWRLAACEEVVWFYLNFWTWTFSWENEDESWFDFVRSGYIEYEKWWDIFGWDIKCFINLAENSVSVNFMNRKSIWSIVWYPVDYIR